MNREEDWQAFCAADKEIFCDVVGAEEGCGPDDHGDCFYLAVRDKDRKFAGWRRKMAAPSLVLAIVSPSVSA